MLQYIKIRLYYFVFIVANKNVDI